MQITHPFGLALSGGGFRAAAFHLGVLKRLRELGLLAQVDVMSTVSGGSIAGAYWVYWQALKGDTLTDDEEWAKFEASLIDFMQSGVRERIVWKVFGIPVLCLGSIVGGYTWGLGPAEPIAALTLCFVLLAGAYLAWHYAAPKLLAREYERLFEYAKLHDLAPGSEFVRDLRRLIAKEGFGKPPGKIPDLFINATLLNTGSHMFFSSNQGREIGTLRHETEMFPTPPLRMDPINEAITGLNPFLPGLSRPQVSMPMPADTLLSKAVASSSAIPFVFSPVRFIAPLRKVDDLLREKLWSTIEREGTCWSIDGGVFDNQGTQLLLKKACSSIIVSDGSGALVPQVKPSTWQMLPPGKGVVSRSFNITYERSRDLGYIRVADKHELVCMLTDFSMLMGMPELAPAVVDAAWRENQRLAEILAHPLGPMASPEKLREYMLLKNRHSLAPFGQDDEAISKEWSVPALQPYDKEFLEAFRTWSRDPSQIKPGKSHKAHRYWRDQLLKKLEKYGPYVTGYAYVELAPNVDFRWHPGMPRLPEQLIPFVASVRTDLDRFSSEEISA